jgi:hypothetical protein
VAIAALVLLVLICTSSVHALNIQPPISDLQFPTQKGSIRLDIPNATLDKAISKDGAWEFLNLQSPNQRKLNLTVSVENCNATIRLYRNSRSNTTMGIIQIRYTVDGPGKQTFNFGDIPKRGIWNVVFGTDYMGQEDGWTISNGTVTVTGASTIFNISIIYYVYPTFFEEIYTKPFLEQNSVAITTGIIIAATITIAVILKLRQNNVLNKEKLKQQQNHSKEKT